MEDKANMTVMRFTSGLAPTGINTNKEELSIHIHPNPFSDELNISIPDFENNSRLEIYSYDGRMVYSIKLFEETQSIKLKLLPTGTYIARIINDESVYSKLIIKD
jgi:hypothetical protein